jgi:predicted secreted protein
MKFAKLKLAYIMANEKPTNALIIQCVGIQHSPTCFGLFKMPSSGSQT